jgi:hypothetical protein
MDAPELPKTGGSYERQDDGSLTLLHATQPAPPPSAPAAGDQPAAAPSTDSQQPAAPAEHQES